MQLNIQTRLPNPLQLIALLRLMLHHLFRILSVSLGEFTAERTLLPVMKYKIKQWSENVLLTSGMTVSRLFSSLSLENHNSTPRSHPPVIREPNFGKLLSRNSIKRSTSAPHSTINSTRKGRTEMYQKSVKLSPCRLTASRRQIAMTRHAFNHCLADTQFESSAFETCN